MGVSWCSEEVKIGSRIGVIAASAPAPASWNVAEMESKIEVIVYPEVDKLRCRECVCDGADAIAHGARARAGTGASPYSRAGLVGGAGIGAASSAAWHAGAPCAGADHCQ